MKHRRSLSLVAAVALAGTVVSVRRNRRPRAGLPAPESLVVTPGYRDGTGTPLLLLHGVGGNWRVWSPVLPHLEEHHDVIAPTLLGHGGAARFPVGVEPSIEALADGLEEALDEAGIAEVHVVGNSLGGWVALELARRGRARSVVVFSPAGAWRSQWRISSRATGIRVSVGLISRCAAHADALSALAWVRWLMLSTQVAYPMRVQPALLAADIRASGDAPGVVPLLRAIPKRQIDGLPADRSFPIRVVWAASDRVLPFKHFGAPMLDLLPGAEIIHQKGTGHIPMSDDPIAVARLILEVTQAVDHVNIPTAVNG